MAAIQTQTTSNTFFEWMTVTNQIITYLATDLYANVGNTTNGYVVTVGTAGNTYTNTVFGYSNTYARTVGAASNAWSNTVFAYSNTYTDTANNFAVAYAQTVGTAGNSYAQAVGTGGNNYTNTVGAGSNNYTNIVFGYSNTYAQTVGAAANGWANLINGVANTTANSALAVGVAAFGQANTVRNLANTSVQNNSTTLITAGYTVNSYFTGVFSAGTWTPDPTVGNYQYLTSNGVFTIAAPTTNCAIDVLFTNGVAANTLTFSGYTTASSVGDPFTTTNGNRFLVSIRRINNISTYLVKALQ